MSGSRRTILLTAGAVAVIALSVGHRRPLLVWNATASAPVGLYAVGGVVGLQPGDRVLLDPPPALARWLESRGYIPPGVPLIKTVAAVPGQIVCRRDNRFAVGHWIVARLRSHDGRGRPMPAWKGCRRLREGEVVVLGEGGDSLDSRYFGPLPADSIRGRLTFLWAPRS